MSVLTTIRAKVGNALAKLGNRLVPGRVQAADTWLEKMSPAQIRMVLNCADAGDFSSADELYSKMQNTWPMLAKCLYELRSAVAAATYVVRPYRVGNAEPTSSAIERADLVRDALDDALPTPGSDETGIEGARFDLTDAIIMGASAVEVLWHRRSDGVITPRAYAHVPARQLAYSTDGVLGYVSAARPAVAPYRDITPFDPDRFLVARYRSRSGALTQGSLIRPLAWWWGCMMFGREWLLSYTERFGSPFRLSHYAPGISAEDKARLDEMLEKAGHAGWASLPAGNTLELIEAKSSGTAPHKELLELADRYAALLILGQTLTSTTPESGGGTRAQGEVHEGIRRERLEALARWVGDVLSYQLAPAICRLNFGDDDECPIIAPDFVVPEDPLAKVQRLTAVAQLVPVSKAWVYDELQIPLPADDDDTLGGHAESFVQKYDPNKDIVAQRMLWREEWRREQAEKERAEKEQALQARMPGLVRALSDLGSSLSEDLRPVRRRLEKALAQENEEDAKQELRELLADLPQLFRRINADPDTAREIETAIVAALAGGVATPVQARESKFITLSDGRVIYVGDREPTAAKPPATAAEARERLAKAKTKAEIEALTRVENPSKIAVKSDSKREFIDRGVARVEAMVSAEVMPREKLRIQEDALARTSSYDPDNGITLKMFDSKAERDRVGSQHVIHEIGHFIEHHNPAVAEAAQEFYDRRTKGDQPIPLNRLPGYGHISSKDIVVKKDKFADPYIGVVYGPKGSYRRPTEVISRGLEMMAKDPVRFAKADPEHFDLIWNIQRGIFK